MMKADMHVHSKYSYDSKMELEDIIETFLKHGIKYVGITDSIEFQKEPLEDIIEKFKIRNQRINQLNEQNEGTITLLKSAEIESPHLYQEEVKRLEELGFDYIVGGIHPFCGRDKVNFKTREEMTKEYYEKILKLIEVNNVEVIQYLDMLDQYFGQDYSSLKQMLEVIEALGNSNQSLEISPSLISKNPIRFYPSIQKLCLYRLKKEDTRVVIGSHAHNQKEILKNFNDIEFACKEIGLTTGIYQKRKFERI